MSGRVAVILLLVCVTEVVPRTCRKYANQVLLVSMDGFRYDYPEKVATPNFDRMARNGVRAAYVNNTFTTKTFPSHYSIATGLYDESHGIVGNHMYDPKYNEIFSMRSHETKWWDQGEPIWITTRKRGLRSGTLFWPGSEVEIQGLRPNTWYTYNESLPFDQRVDMVIDMLKKDKLNFVTTYFHEPDRTGHLFGPESVEVRNKIVEMDTLLGTLLDKLNASGLLETVNLILTSDHGMATTDYDNKLIEIYDLVDRAKINFTVDSGPIMHVVPVEGQVDTVIRKINRNPNFTAYRKEDIPEGWHYKNNRRIMPVFVLAKEGWTITPNKTESRMYPNKGNHGYDNNLMTMRPIFYAMGPNFRSGFSASPLKSIDIYPLICELLGISPSPNNGTLANTDRFLQSFPNDQQVCDGAVSSTDIRSSAILIPLLLVVGVLIS
ncbi:bis(5'-adenosyl)-triphosphatase enpp4-like [Mizuhopecten yessoensis]|uniref:Bis(5'-adenosyl)-triphosphatase enpp4 n=1 Tax=Mizuhopecten yessoensis TaxID=6573 RepID=A0A210QT21_MIZYE|nr:bis(5'-adenosyl)-triphosphatase enpp4-like [Mizuhopecten yessoensis]XP_021350686.1 bis(5'-adenosyl)-triphosphatase enpp4-like [Mizuhopecten yessoensis]XP_021350687.1 bis(5'-adenosyl)-triphosphatase enpp4-like [Mizuhopecten yessoensis]OWF51868.1 Bis(5'-adenosyl)-triphosphatase enpp4 [Mizuhopecten yessoensis]